LARILPLSPLELAIVLICAPADFNLGSIVEPVKFPAPIIPKTGFPET